MKSLYEICQIHGFDNPDELFWAAHYGWIVDKDTQYLDDMMSIENPKKVLEKFVDWAVNSIPDSVHVTNIVAYMMTVLYSNQKQ